jgi:hypothetical protein
MAKKRKSVAPDESRSDSKLGEPVICKVVEVTAQECNGDVSRMIKRFTKKVRKEEVLKPFYGKLMFFETKSQKRRQAKIKGTYEWHKKEQKLEDD